MKQQGAAIGTTAVTFVLIATLTAAMIATALVGRNPSDPNGDPGDNDPG